jgi:hypothetical protein
VPHCQDAASTMRRTGQDASPGSFLQDAPLGRHQNAPPRNLLDAPPGRATRTRHTGQDAPPGSYFDRQYSASSARIVQDAAASTPSTVVFKKKGPDCFLIFFLRTSV